jgi:hypothetical protein
MKESTSAVRDSLPKEKQTEFDEAVRVLAFSQVDMKDIAAARATGVDLEEKVRSSLDGKTAEEVITGAAKIKAERKAREEKQALEEIAELEARLAQSLVARESLKDFEVIRSRFELREQRFSGKQPIIELKVRNGTKHAVARAYFEGTIASPGRSVPWIKDTFNYSISGGLEPGEEAEWSLAPNMFSDWGKVEAPADAIFTVVVTRLDGADGEPIFGGEGLTERQLKRLEELKQKFGK